MKPILTAKTAVRIKAHRRPFSQARRIRFGRPGEDTKTGKKPTDHATMKALTGTLISLKMDFVASGCGSGGRALGSGPRSRRFKSSHSDQKKSLETVRSLGFLLSLPRLRGNHACAATAPARHRCNCGNRACAATAPARQPRKGSPENALANRAAAQAKPLATPPAKSPTESPDAPLDATPAELLQVTPAASPDVPYQKSELYFDPILLKALRHGANIVYLEYW